MAKEKNGVRCTAFPSAEQSVFFREQIPRKELSHCLLMSVRVVFEEKKIIVAVVAITLLQLYSSNILSSQEIPRKGMVCVVKTKNDNISGLQHRWARRTIAPNIPWHGYDRLRNSTSRETEQIDLPRP